MGAGPAPVPGGGGPKVRVRAHRRRPRFGFVTIPRNPYCKGLTACAADPYYTSHVHKIVAKSIQNEAKSGPGAVPETLPKKSSKKLPKVNQKAPKVDQKAPPNDPQNVFKMIKNGLGAFVSTSKKR